MKSTPRKKMPRRAPDSIPSTDSCRIAEDSPDGVITEALASHHAPQAAKVLGAYYTDAGIAEFLTRWSIRSAEESVLDPSSGGGAFLAAASRRLGELGGRPAAQICGVEVDAGTCQRVTAHFLETVGWNPRLHCEDFFALKPSFTGLFDVVVGNPPFIRYQQFGGEMRNRALGCALRQGVKLNRLCSSWAPFLVHATAFLKPGGRLAMVLPQELLHAGYAAPVLRYLAATFRRVSVLTFKQKLFPDLSENTLLVLGEDKSDNARGEVRVLDSEDPTTLFKRIPGRMWSAGEAMSRETLSGERRAIEQLLPAATRELYHSLLASSAVSRLGEFADVGIGYVSGANDFFHPSTKTIAEYSIPRRFLRAAVRKGAALRSTRFTKENWTEAEHNGDASMLLLVNEPEANLPAGLRDYLELGCAKGIHSRYKCRVRKRWFAVPNVHVGDAFLTYMSGARTRLSANLAGAVATNTLHVLRMKLGAPAPEALAAGWLTSLTTLSVEVEGHALGGGMLKLEPTEAERVLVATNRCSLPIPADLSADEADRMFLKPIGLSVTDIRRLREGAQLLRARRGINEVFS